MLFFLLDSRAEPFSVSVSWIFLVSNPIQIPELDSDPIPEPLSWIFSQVLVHFLALVWIELVLDLVTAFVLVLVLDPVAQKQSFSHSSVLCFLSFNFYASNLTSLCLWHCVRFRPYTWNLNSGLIEPQNPGSVPELQSQTILFPLTPVHVSVFSPLSVLSHARNP